MERERVIEVLLVMVFIVMIFIMILIGLSVGSADSSSSKIVSNSYNNIDNSHKVYYSQEKIVNNVKKPNNNYIKKTVKKQPLKPKTKKYYLKTDKKTHYPAYNTKNNYYKGHKTYSPVKNYVWDDWSDWELKDHDSYGKHTKEKKYNSYADTYKVYLQNNGKSDYFTVRFYFEDYWGDEKSYDIRKYVYGYDEELFYFRDISHDKLDYYNWRYVILD